MTEAVSDTVTETLAETSNQTLGDDTLDLDGLNEFAGRVRRDSHRARRYKVRFRDFEDRD